MLACTHTSHSRAKRLTPRPVRMRQARAVYSSFSASFAFEGVDRIYYVKLGDRGGKVI